MNAVVALQVLGLGEVGGEHEVQVPGRGVAGDSGQEAVLGRAAPGGPWPSRRTVGRVRRRPRRSARFPVRASCRPARASPRGRASRPRSSPRRDETRASRISSRPASSFAARRLGGVELGLVVGAELDQQRRRVRVELAPALRRPADVVAGDDQRRRDHQLDRAGAGGDEVGDRRDRRVDAREVKPGDRCPLRLWHGLEHRLGDERERPLRADDQAAEDLQRRLGVEEGAEAVAGRVLDLELAPDPLAELGVGEDLVADLEQAGGELGLGAGEALLGARLRRCRSPSRTGARRSSSATVCRSRG